MKISFWAVLAAGGIGYYLYRSHNINSKVSAGVSLVDAIVDNKTSELDAKVRGGQISKAERDALVLALHNAAHTAKVQMPKAIEAGLPSSSAMVRLREVINKVDARIKQTSGQLSRSGYWLQPARHL